MAHVANVQRSVDFYQLFGMEVRGCLRNPSGELQWVHLACEQAELMFSRASAPVIADQQAVLFSLLAGSDCPERTPDGERRGGVRGYVSSVHAEG